MKKVVLFSIFFMLLLHAASAQSLIIIKVQEDGNAVWILEKHIPLETQTDVEDWEEFIGQAQDSDQYLQDLGEFSNRIGRLTESAGIFSNRQMSAENFSVDYATSKTLSGSFGIVRFSFEWTNFSQIESDNILIGDVFSEGMILTSEHVLVIQIPTGYEMVSVSPEFDMQDGNRFIWKGAQYRSFDRGEPALVLSRTSSVQANDQNIWYFLIIIIFGSAMAIYFKRRNKPAFNADINPKEPPNRAETMDYLEYEEMITQILTRSGGQAYQSEIVKKSGLSKSKISLLLTKMNEEGKIVKIRKGKENIIRFSAD